MDSLHCLNIHFCVISPRLSLMMLVFKCVLLTSYVLVITTQITECKSIDITISTVIINNAEKSDSVDRLSHNFISCHD